MGCCPSKSRAKRDAHAAASCSADLTESRDVAATAAVDGNACSPCVTSNQHGDATLLMDRGDGTLVILSDGDPTPSSPPGEHTLERSRSSDAGRDAESSASTSTTKASVTGSSSSGNNNNADDSTVDGTRAAELTTEQTSANDLHASPECAVLQSSPRKAPVNFDELPINSMYHRIHVVEAEALDAKRQAEQRAEAERREREVREFKAAMHLAP